MGMSLKPKFHPSHCCLTQNPARAAGREAAAQWGWGRGFPKVRGQADRFWSAGVQVTLSVGGLGVAAGADAENLLPRSCLLVPQFPR